MYEEKEKISLSKRLLRFFGIVAIVTLTIISVDRIWPDIKESNPQFSWWGILWTLLIFVLILLPEKYMCKFRWAFHLFLSIALIPIVICCFLERDAVAIDVVDSSEQEISQPYAISVKAPHEAVDTSAKVDTLMQIAVLKERVANKEKMQNKFLQVDSVVGVKVDNVNTLLTELERLQASLQAPIVLHSNRKSVLRVTLDGALLPEK